MLAQKEKKKRKEEKKKRSASGSPDRSLNEAAAFSSIHRYIKKQMNVVGDCQRTVFILASRCAGIETGK